MADKEFQAKAGFITTGAKEADGGDILIKAGHLFYLVDSEITASVGGGAETSGGNISIDSNIRF